MDLKFPILLATSVILASCNDAYLINARSDLVTARIDCSNAKHFAFDDVNADGELEIWCEWSCAIHPATGETLHLHYTPSWGEGGPWWVTAECDSFHAQNCSYER